MCYVKDSVNEENTKEEKKVSEKRLIILSNPDYL